MPLSSKNVSIARVQDAEGRLAERLLSGGGRIVCPPGIVPEPGQYVAVCAPSLAPVLTTAVFAAGQASDGFLAAPDLPPEWSPGVRLSLRGPIGRGFEMPLAARRVALISQSAGPERLLSLVGAALAQAASVVLVSDRVGVDVPAVVEIQPASAMRDVYGWADYAAFELERDQLPGLQTALAEPRPDTRKLDMEVLVRAPMPCAAKAECGACAVITKRGWKMACKDGPVLKLSELL